MRLAATGGDAHAEWLVCLAALILSLLVAWVGTGRVRVNTRVKVGPSRLPRRPAPLPARRLGRYTYTGGLHMHMHVSCTSVRTSHTSHTPHCRRVHQTEHP